MEKAKHEVLVQNWARNIEQRINSSMTIKEWYRANNIMESQYYWLKVVRREVVQQAGGTAMTDGNAGYIYGNTGAVRSGTAICGMPPPKISNLRVCQVKCVSSEFFVIGDHLLVAGSVC